MVAWLRARWEISVVSKARFSISVQVSEIGSTFGPWWLTVVYGPQSDADKVEFLAELRQFRARI